MKPYDCCKSEWKEKLKNAYNLAQEAIRKITFNGKTYTPDGSGAVTLDDPKADDIDLTDGRSVQTAVDAIEDEIGDDDTAGSLRQYADQSLNKVTVPISPDTYIDNDTTITTDSIGLETYANSGQMSATTIFMAGKGISIGNNRQLSVRTGNGLGFDSNYNLENTGITDISVKSGSFYTGLTKTKGDGTTENITLLTVTNAHGLTSQKIRDRLNIKFDPSVLNIPKIFNFSSANAYSITINPSIIASYTGTGKYREKYSSIPMVLQQNGDIYAFGKGAELYEADHESTFYSYGVTIKDILDSEYAVSWLREVLGITNGYVILFGSFSLFTATQYVFYDTSTSSFIDPNWYNVEIGIKGDGTIYYDLGNNDWSTIFICGLNQNDTSVMLGIAGEGFIPQTTE